VLLELLAEVLAEVLVDVVAEVLVDALAGEPPTPLVLAPPETFEPEPQATTNGMAASAIRRRIPADLSSESVRNMAATPALAPRAWGT
jgi:hypothetical protein